METALLNEFPEPFAAPFPEYFFLQAKFANCQVRIDTLRLLSTHILDMEIIFY